MEVEDKSTRKYDALKGFAKEMIGVAKGIMDTEGLKEDPQDTNLQAIGFLCKCVEEEDGSLTIASMAIPAHSMATESDKDLVSAVLRSGAYGLNADAVVWLSDALYWEPDPKKMAEDGITPERFPEVWPFLGYEKRCEYAVPRDCIQVIVDAKFGHCMISQHYTKECGKAVWGKLEVRDAGEKDKVSGRFGKFLREDQSPESC
jgi:hypothetical protein